MSLGIIHTQKSIIDNNPKLKIEMAVCRGGEREKKNSSILAAVKSR